MTARPEEQDGGEAGSRSPGRLPSDLIVGGCILLFCAAAYGVTLTFAKAPAVVAQNVQPATFPRLVLGVIAVLTLIMMVLARGRPERPRRRVRAMTWLSAAVMVGFVLAFQWLGIVPAMVLLCLGLPVLWGERRSHLVLPFGLGFPLAVYLLFVEVLEVHFEPSPLVFW
jgi:putative tricarboxylic transport membrane protein